MHEAIFASRALTRIRKAANGKQADGEMEGNQSRTMR
jgi:hypothetical protein